jgi:uncharacterized protein (DUF488 family)
MLKCITVGYQNRKAHEMAEELAAAGAETLLDVREAPWSQRPEFRKTALQQVLEARGIRYEHQKAAGNPFRPRAGEKLTAQECARRYAAHLERNPWILDVVLKVLERSTTALLCYERHASDCHRGVLVEALLARRPGLEVLHLA